MKTTDYEAIFELYDKGMSWDEIREELPWFTDTDRKKFYGYKEALDMVGVNGLDERLQKRQQNIRLERKILGYERSINNEQIRDLALSQVLQRQLKESLAEIKPINLKDISKISIKELNKSHKKFRYIVTTGDLHYSGDYEETLMLFEELLNSIAFQIEKHDIKHLYLVEVGDIIEGAGNLRPSQAQAVRAGMVTQMSDIMKIYADFVNKLSKMVKLTFIIVTSSNHTQLRLMGSKQNELVEEDLMILFAQYMQAMFPKLKIIADIEPTLQIGEYNLLFTHGHTIKGQRQAEKEIQNASIFRNEVIDYLFLGHYHHFRAIDISKGKKKNYFFDKRVFFLPTLDTHMSTFEKDRKLSSVPGYGFFEFNEEYGNTIAQKIPIADSVNEF